MFTGNVGVRLWHCISGRDVNRRIAVRVSDTCRAAFAPTLSTAAERGQWLLTPRRCCTILGRSSRSIAVGFTGAIKPATPRKSNASLSLFQIPLVFATLMLLLLLTGLGIALGATDFVLAAESVTMSIPAFDCLSQCVDIVDKTASIDSHCGYGPDSLPECISHPLACIRSENGFTCQCNPASLMDGYFICLGETCSSIDVAGEAFNQLSTICTRCETGCCESCWLSAAARC